LQRPELGIGVRRALRSQAPAVEDARGPPLARGPGRARACDAKPDRSQAAAAPRAARPPGRGAVAPPARPVAAAGRHRTAPRPPAGPVRALTARIEQALAAVTLQAEQAEAHALVDRAHRIVSAQDDAPAGPPSLVDEFALRRRLLAGYDVVRSQWPERFAALAT